MTKNHFLEACLRWRFGCPGFAVIAYNVYTFALAYAQNSHFARGYVPLQLISCFRGLNSVPFLMLNNNRFT